MSSNSDDPYARYDEMVQAAEDKYRAAEQRANAAYDLAMAQAEDDIDRALAWAREVLAQESM